MPINMINAMAIAILKDTIKPIRYANEGNKVSPSKIEKTIFSPSAILKLPRMR